MSGFLVSRFQHMSLFDLFDQNTLLGGTCVWTAENIFEDILGRKKWTKKTQVGPFEQQLILQPISLQLKKLLVVAEITKLDFLERFFYFIWVGDGDDNGLDDFVVLSMSMASGL